MILNYGQHYIDESDIAAVSKVLRNDKLTQGEVVDQFEQALRIKFGSKYCSVVTNGTAALHIAGKVLNWSQKDIVITSPITFLASANAIVYNGATPDFCDIDPNYYTIDLNKLEDKIKSYQKIRMKVKSIIGVDYAGQPCDWKNLSYIARKYNISLINDCCHAMGAELAKDIKYASKYADIVTQSYHPVKNFTTGEGGALLTNNYNYEKKIKLLRSHNMIKSTETSKKGLWYYQMNELGYNYRLTDFQCALGISQLKKLDKFVNVRRKIAHQYDKIFSNNDIFTIPKVKKDVTHAYHLYPLLIDFKKCKVSKVKFFQKALKKKIRLQVHYQPIYRQNFYKKNYLFKNRDFKVSENFYKQEVSLPIYYKLTNQEQTYIKKTILNILDIN